VIDLVLGELVFEVVFVLLFGQYFDYCWGDFMWLVVSAILFELLVDGVGFEWGFICMLWWVDGVSEGVLYVSV